jgi:hypothetical protein
MHNDLTASPIASPIALVKLFEALSCVSLQVSELPPGRHYDLPIIYDVIIFVVGDSAVSCLAPNCFLTGFLLQKGVFGPSLDTAAMQLKSYP